MSLPVRRAAVSLAAFLLPALLFPALGPAGGLGAAFVLCVGLVLGVRRPGAWLAAAALAGGTAWHGFLRPIALYRNAGLSPRAVVGVDGAGGAFVRDRTGVVFHAARGGSWEKLPLPRDLRLGRVGLASGAVVALEIRPEGDRFWRVERGSVTSAGVGAASGEAVFVADWAVDEGRPVAVDALGGRIVWVGPGGRIERSEVPPPGSGSPRLVAASAGSVHVLTDQGALLSLGPRGSWSVLRGTPPPGRAMALSEREGRFTLLMRGDRGACSVWQLAGGVAGRWKKAASDARWPRAAVDGETLYELAGGGVTARPLAATGHEPARLGPPRSLTRAFDRTPAGALIRLVE